MRLRLFTGTVMSTISLAALGALAIPAAFAQSGPAPDAPDQAGTEKVVVTATRTEKQLDEVAATVSVFTAADIENNLVTDIKDLVRFEPGVSVRSSPSRFSTAQPPATGRDGNSGFNIRGLEGNRVLMLVDGVRVPDGYDFGAQGVGRGDYVDLDLVKSVEILRGPTSALYGSDGLAGAVSFITRDPGDMVPEGRNFGARARSSYASADESWANSLIGAGKAGDWSAMLAYTRRDSEAPENMGVVDTPDNRRTTPNPTEREQNSYLAKVVWKPGENHRFRLTFDQSQSVTQYDVLSAQAVIPPLPATPAASAVIDLESRDTSLRKRVAFDHFMTFGEGFLRSAQWNIYQQESDTRQYTSENRYTSADRIRDNTYDTDVIGASGQIAAYAVTGALEHNFLFGADWSETRQSNIRRGTVPPTGETFPNRASPLTDFTLAGVFLQDEISLLDGQLLLYPVVRYDSYEIDPIRDALYPATFDAEPSDGDQISPKLGIVAWPTNWLGAYFNYAEGFKAPAPGQVNEGFENLMFGYTTIANPNLRPESSQSTEVGVRLRDVPLFGGEWSGSVAAYATDFDDFIINDIVSGTGAPGDPLVFQYINVDAVAIEGVEAQINAQWDNGFGLRLAASKSEGVVNASPGSPLETIDPAQLVAGLLYNDPQGRFGGQLIATLVDGKGMEDIAENLDTNPANDLFAPGGFTTLDLTAYWNISNALTLRGGVFNITDEKYWWWGDVRGQLASSATLDAFTQPGTNYSASLTFKY